MDKALPGIRLLLQVFIWCGIAAVPMFKLDYLGGLFFALILYFILAKDKKGAILNNLTFLALMLQYPIWNIVRLSLTPEHGYESLMGVAEYKMWIFSAAAIILLVVFFHLHNIMSLALLYLFFMIL